MIKKLLTTLAVAAMLSSVSIAQWTNTGAWPDETWIGSTHGIAVDPDGKVWVGSYYAEVPWIQGEDTTMAYGLYVYNADGTEADFSPIITVTSGGGFTVDTLGAQRGLATDENGNIVYVQSGPSKMIKINYQTGEGMAVALIPETGSSPTSPGVADDGTIFVGPVVGGAGKAIAMYDTDLNYLGNAVDGPGNISRALEVSADGNTIYWHVFTGPVETVVYQRADEFSPYDSVDVMLQGVSIETSKWNNADGKLYVSQDARGADSSYLPLTWYAVDVATKEATEAFSFELLDPEAADQYPRGLAFTEDGNTGYIGTFSAVQHRMQKVVRSTEAVSITFECDMSVQVDYGLFDPSSGTVTVAGTFNGWDAAANALTDGDGDLVYSATIDGFTPGETIEFKFVKNGDGWEGIDNRTYTVPAEGGTYSALFDNFEGGTEIGVTFLANMEFEIASERFDPANDTLSARGSMNGWSDSDIMTPTVGDPNIYEVTVNMTVNADDVVNYKFAYTHGGGVNWEGDPNKTYTFTQADIDAGFAQVGPRTYNNLTLESILNHEATIKFVCDMNGAINNLTGTEFAAIENVFIAGAVPPLSWPGGGWPDSDEDLVHFLNDDGGGIWSVELTFPIYSPLTIQYKYGANWGGDNGGANDNEAGVGEDHFLTIPNYLWYGEVQNQFGVTGEHTLATDVEPVDAGVPDQYSLGQNYPNPFNPTTLIRFAIPEASNVTLKVYDMLGQEVATVLDEQKSAGTYEVNFDASKLTTGVYVYTIKAGNFVATKKMMLVK